MKDDATVAVTVPADRLAEIDEIATATERTRDDVVREAIDQYLDVRGWQIERIEAGLADIREGRIIPAETVFAQIAAKRGWSL